MKSSQSPRVPSAHPVTCSWPPWTHAAAQAAPSLPGLHFMLRYFTNIISTVTSHKWRSSKYVETVAEKGHMIKKENKRFLEVSGPKTWEGHMVAAWTVGEQP